MGLLESGGPTECTTPGFREPQQAAHRSEWRFGMGISSIAKTTAGNIIKGPSCTVCRALDELPKDDAAGLLELLSDRARRFTEIADLIHEDEDTPDWVRKIHHSTYARHAKGQCAARTRLR